MSRNVTLSVFRIVGSALCVASDDGQKVFERIAPLLKQGEVVTLSFDHVTSLTSAFLNAAVGQLYGVFTDEEIRAGLRVADMEPDDVALLRRVVKTAKQYFKDPERFKQAIREEMGDNDGE